MKKENQCSVHEVSEYQNSINSKSHLTRKHHKEHNKNRGEIMCKFCGNKYVLKEELCLAWGKFVKKKMSL